MAKSHCLKVGALEYTDRLLHNMPLSFHTREFRVHNFTPNKPPTNLVVSKWKPWLLHGGRRRVMRKTDVRRSCTVGAKARAVLPRKSSDCFSNFSFSTEYVFRVCLAGGGAFNSAGRTNCENDNNNPYGRVRSVKPRSWPSTKIILLFANMV